MKRSKTLFLFISLVLLIILRFFTTRPVYKNGDNVRITSSVLSDPIRYSTSQGIKIAGLKVYLPLYPEVSYGDKIIVEGVTQNGKLEKAKLVKILDEKSFLSGFRNRVIRFYQEVLPANEAGLVGGVVLGSKNSLPKSFYDYTKNIGVAHIVVASGTNVTFVVSFLMGATTLFLSRRKAIVFVILGIILYLFISGFDAPLIRAENISHLIASGEEESNTPTASERIIRPTKSSAFAV